jgi:hypothetical protein
MDEEWFTSLDEDSKDVIRKTISSLRENVIEAEVNLLKLDMMIYELRLEDE